MTATPAIVQLFHTCLVNEMAPEVGLAVVRVLERRGFAVEVPPAQTCCGQPAYNAGFRDQARAVARHTLRVLSATDGPVVVPSGSCADMLIHQYPLLFHDEPAWRDRARAVAARCREFSQFVAQAAPPGTATRAVPARVAYHASCHLSRGLGVRTEPVALLETIDGVEVAEVAGGDECCGFGGLFSVTSPQISGDIMARKLGAVEASGAQRLVSCDLGCLMHLAGGLRRRGSAIRTQHLAELLEEALG